MAAVPSGVGLLLLVLFLIGIVSLYLALRNRLAWRIAMRNVRRGGGRTILLILGLLIGTTIISGSLVVGDTVNQLDLHFTYIALGLNDELIYNQTPTGGNTYFPYSVYAQLNASESGAPYVAGLAPLIVGTTQAFDKQTGVPQTGLNLIGVNGNQSSQLGPFVSDAGTNLAGPAPGEALLDDLAASELGASAGQTLILFGAGASQTPVTVQAIVHDDDRGGFLTGGLGNAGSVFVTLAAAQTIAAQPGAINMISVTNTGSQDAGVGHSDTVSAGLNASLAAIPAASGLTVYESLRAALASGATAGSSLSTLFLVLGLFSIVAGAMLIVGIFVMLAEERKGEMGMLRAIGLTRSQLIYSFYFEGLAYSAGSAFAGTVVGVGVGYGLTYAFSVLLGGSGLPQNAILDSFTVLPSSLIIAYVAGFLLTLITVYGASRRASRLNIVRAIRDIPEPPPTLRLYSWLAVLGALLALLGAYTFATTRGGATDISYPILGGALFLVGVGLVGARFLPNRIVFSAVGAGLLIWAGVEPLHTAVLGSAHTGGIFTVFTEGITMVVGALLLYIFNSAVVVAALSKLAEGRSGRAPVARIALAYPGRQPTRTTINLAIFSLVIFTLVAIATFGATLQVNLSNSEQGQSGGYTYFGVSTTPIPNFAGVVANNSTLSNDFSDVVSLVSGGIYLHVPGYAQPEFGDSVYAAPSGGPPNADFYSTSQFPFTQTWHGMSATEVLAQLSSNASVAIVDHSYAPATVSVSSGPSGPHPVLVPGDTTTLTDPATGNSTTVTVIGVMTQSILSGIWVNPSAAAALGYHGASTYLLSLNPGVDANTAAQKAKSAFLPYGLVLFDYQSLLASSLSTTEGIIGLLQIFVALGLAVGIAGMGIVALRAVVERRREIGMLRASGFTQRMILGAFVLEYSFVALLGIAIGTGLGLLIVFNLAASPSASAAGITSVAVPWTNLAIILVVAYGLAMAAVAGPSLRAARLPPADAVRATE